jgi:serine/threonine-protein kinase
MNAVRAGDQLGQYILRREIGAGAMAAVYEAEHVVLGKRVALKRMHPQLALDATAAERFLREGKAATQIRSTHVVEVFDVGSHEGVPYLIMELLEGRDLAEHLREKRRMDLRELADCMLPIAAGVHAAHEAGVIHRDLKPSNVFLSLRAATVSPMILDFGISRMGSAIDGDLTRSDVLLGTVAYMSPEQTSGGKNATALSDQYALGVLLYECSTGHKPFSGTSPYSLMHAIVSSTPRHPSALVSSLPHAFDRVVLRAMHKDPRQRFPSVRALGEALLPWASEMAGAQYLREVGMDASQLGAAERPHFRRWLVAAGIGLVSLAAVAASVHAARQTRPDAMAPAAASTAAGPRVSAVAPRPASPVETPIAADDVPVADSVTVPAAVPASPPKRAADRGDLVPSRSSLLAGKLQDASSPLSHPSSPARPERGTNGAVIVE